MPYSLSGHTSPSAAILYGALDARSVRVLACAPIGLASNLDPGYLAFILGPYDDRKIADVLQCSRERLALEASRTSGVADAFALILEEKVRGGVFRFSDLLVSYSVESLCNLIIAPTAERASLAMLETDLHPVKNRAHICADSDTQNGAKK